MTLFGAVGSAQALSRSLFLQAFSARPGGTAPAASSLGTTPTVGTRLFTATNQLLSFVFTMPQNWDRTQNCTLVLRCAMNAARTNAQTLDLTLDYTVPLQLTTGSGVGKTSTALTASRAVTTGEGLATGDIYPVSFTLPSGEATNPFSSANSLGFCCEIRMTNITGVAGFHLTGIRLDYVALR